MPTTGFSYIGLHNSTHNLSLGLFKPFPLTQLMIAPLPGFPKYYFNAEHQSAIKPYLINSHKANC